MDHIAPVFGIPRTSITWGGMGSLKGGITGHAYNGRARPWSPFITISIPRDRQQGNFGILILRFWDILATSIAPVAENSPLQWAIPQKPPDAPLTGKRCDGTKIPQPVRDVGLARHVFCPVAIADPLDADQIRGPCTPPRPKRTASSTGPWAWSTWASCRPIFSRARCNGRHRKTRRRFQYFKHALVQRRPTPASTCRSSLGNSRRNSHR